MIGGRLKQQDDYDVGRPDVTDIACFALTDGVGGDGRCGGGVRTLCQRSVSCAARRKMASSSSIESRDLSPYEAAASTTATFPGELHGRVRHSAGGEYPNALLASGRPGAAGYACMTLLSPAERDCSPEPEIQLIGAGAGSCRCDCDAKVGSSRICRCGAELYGCRVVGVDRKRGSTRKCPASRSVDHTAHVPHCGNVAAAVANAVVYTCSKHRNVTLGGGGSDDGLMTSLQGRGQPLQHRFKENNDESVVQMAIETGDVF